MRPSDELVMAYVDGELAPDEAARVEAAMASDPAVADAVARERALRARLRQALDPVLDEPVPEHLLAIARGTPTAPAATVQALPVVRRRRWALPEWTAMAAALVLGVAVSQLARDGTPPPLLSQDGRLLADGALAASLQSRLGAETGDGLQIGLSFRDRDGQYCRGFRLGGEHELAGLACRTADGRWQVPVVVSVAASDPGELRQAGTGLPEIVLAEVDARIAGEPLDAAQEREARDAGWR